MRRINVCIIITLISVFILGITGCGGVDDPDMNEQQSFGSGDASNSGASSNQTGSPGSSGPSDSSGVPESSGSSGSSDAGEGDDTWRISIIDTNGQELWSFTEAELNRLPSATDLAFTHVYSTINNWPNTRFYAADGYRIESILAAAGALDGVQTFTFRSTDGYEVRLTQEQLLSSQYYFPQAGENDSGAAPVFPIITRSWRDGTDDIDAIRDDKPMLIFGQRNPFEHTNPAFVEALSEIIVDYAPSQTWPMAGTFPQPGQIATGDTVNLQHPSYGLVKLHYTLDGSDPTPLSAMYNPSTYQPELNRPITITEPTIIKVLVTGYGRNDSEIAVFEFIPVD